MTRRAGNTAAVLSILSAIAWQPDLAKALISLAFGLSDMRQRADALASAAANPDAFRPDLARRGRQGVRRASPKCRPLL
jgi:hypothetical protein